MISNGELLVLVVLTLVIPVDFGHVYRETICLEAAVRRAESWELQELRAECAKLMRKHQEDQHHLEDCGPHGQDIVVIVSIVIIATICLFLR